MLKKPPKGRLFLFFNYPPMQASAQGVWRRPPAAASRPVAGQLPFPAQTAESERLREIGILFRQ